MDWTSVAIFHHADQELLLGSSKSNNKSYKKQHEEIKLFTSTASPTANNQHTNHVSEPSQFISFQTLKVYDLHSSGISKEPLLLASNRGLASPSAKMNGPGKKNGELKYAWGGVECFFRVLRLVLIFHELLVGLIAVKHWRFSPKFFAYLKC